MGHYDDVQERVERKELESSLQGLSLIDAYYKGLTEFRGRGWHDTPTLRDKFAMAALGALLPGAETKAACESVAKDAYFFADEMLKARKKNG